LNRLLVAPLASGFRLFSLSDFIESELAASGSDCHSCGVFWGWATRCSWFGCDRADCLAVSFRCDSSQPRFSLSAGHIELIAVILLLTRCFLPALLSLPYHLCLNGCRLSLRSILLAMRLNRFILSIFTKIGAEQCRNAGPWGAVTLESCWCYSALTLWLCSASNPTASLSA